MAKPLRTINHRPLTINSVSTFRAERDQKLLMQQILNADPPLPSQLNSQVPADLDTLCLKCLEKDPSRRFPTAAPLAQELHRLLHGEPIHSPPSRNGNQPGSGANATQRSRH